MSSIKIGSGWITGWVSLIRYLTVLGVGISGLACCGAMLDETSCATGTAVKQYDVARERVELISPLEGADVTDIALSFRWWRQTGVEWYDLQVSSDSSFLSLVIDEDVQALQPLANDPEDSWGWGKYGQVAHLPYDVLPAGTYYWRVRAHGDNGGDSGLWSDTRTVSLNNLHSTRDLQRKISADNPLFVLQVWGADARESEKNWSKFWGDIPADIQPYTTVSVNRTRYFAHETFVDAYAKIKQSGMSCMILGSGPNPSQTWESLSELEWVFQNVPNVEGIMSGEVFWGYSEVTWLKERVDIIRYTNRVMQLCAKYGKYYMMADGNWMTSWRWDRYFAKDEKLSHGTYPDQVWMDPDFLRKYRKWLVFGAKSNICWGSYQMSGATQGAWLSGLFDTLGYWAEPWFWRDVGFGAPFESPKAYDKGDFDQMPPSFWNNMLMIGASQGASVFFMDGNTTLWEYDETSTAPTTAIWDRRGKKTPNMDHIVIPFIRAVTSQKLLPTREDVLGELRIAVKSGSNHDEQRVDPYSYRKYEAMYKGTFGVDDSGATDHCGGELWDIIPQTGRYPFIPILPDPVSSLPDSTDLTVVNVASLTDADEVTDLFNSHYPLRYTGDAWVSLVGDKFYIMNSKENQDVTQNFSIQLPGGAITHMSGTIRPFKYILGRKFNDGNSLVLHANTSITQEPTRLTLTCNTQVEPVLTVDPASALISSSWSNQTLSFSLSHSQYAVNVQVDCDQTDDSTTAKTASFDVVQDAFMKGDESFNSSRVKIKPGRFEGYFKFDISGITENVSSAKLMLKCNENSGSGTIRFYEGLHNNWTETTLAVTNQPVKGSEVGSVSGSFSEGVLCAVEVKDLLNGHGDGSYTLIAVMDDGGSDAWFSSKEGEAAPVLNVTYYEEVVENLVPEITTKVLPDGKVNENYAATLHATSGDAPYVWSVTGGKLPAGLTLQSSTGLIHGTPSAGGSQIFEITVADKDQDTDFQKFTLKIGNDSTVTEGKKSFAAIQDTYIEGSSPNNNSHLKVEAGRRVIYLKFKVSGITDNVTSAKLSLKCQEDSGKGKIRFYRGSHNNWTETSLNNTDKPAVETEVGSLSGSYKENSIYEFNVTDLFLESGDGVYTLVGEMDAGGNDVWFSSKEGPAAPLLTVKYNQFIAFERFDSSPDFLGNGSDDDDDDGQPNLLEYATGGDPADAAVQGVNPRLQFDADGTATYILQKRKTTTSRELMYAVEWSDNIAFNNWQILSPLNVLTNEVSGNASLEKIQLILWSGESAPSQCYLRLKVWESEK